MQKSSTLISCILVISLFRLDAQLIPFQNYTVKNGLPSNTIYDIEQDQKGYLWFATQTGAVKFDGYNFHAYTINEGLPDNNISDIFIDRTNRIWLATENGGLAVIDKKKLRLYNEANGLVSDYTQKVFEDKEGNIWYFSFQGVSILKPDTIINYDEHNSDITGRIFSTYIASDGTVWFSTINAIYYYENSTMHRYKNEALAGLSISDITEDKPGSLWFATEDKGVCHVEGLKTTWYNTTNFLKSDISLSLVSLNTDTVLLSTYLPGGLYLIGNGTVLQKWEAPLSAYRIRKIHVDKRRRIWLNTTENGVILIDQNELTFLDRNNNLIDNQIIKIFEDNNGNIWIATVNGISKYGKVVFQIFNDLFIHDDINVMSIAELDNTIYIGTNSGLNILHNDKLIKKFDRSSGLPFYPNIYSILPIDNKNIWLATREGFVHYHDDKFYFYPDTIFLRNEDEPEIITDLKILNNTIYCASSRGLASYSNKKFTNLTPDTDVAVWGIGIDAHNNIWCATVNGLAIYDGNTFHFYDTGDGLPHNYCNDITFDKEGNGWLATDKGLSKIKLHPNSTITCQNFSIKEGLKSDIIFSVLIDKMGFIWAGHNQGIDRINPVDYKVTNYGALEGFLPVETCLGAATTSLGDELWFGSVGGAVKYIPKNDFVYYDPPIVYITDISFYNDTSSILKYASGANEEDGLPINLILPHNKNNLIFNYIGLHYTIIEKNQYRYMLEGYDNDWSEPTHEIKTPPYRKIPPGRYTFKVLASNCDGVWTNIPATFSFEIRPPVWQTWWFYTLELLVAITVFILIIRMRERKLRHDKKVLTEKVRERTIEIEKQRDQISLQKKEITDSIEYAEKIQTAVLPKKEFIDKLLSEYFILFKPRNIVSGDFYWLNRIGDRIILVAADCTGHGVPGAFMSMLGISILNEIASQKQTIDAGRILDTLRDHLTRTLRQTGKEEDAKDGMDLALCIIDQLNHSMQFAGAYNPLVLIHNNEILIYKADKMPVGFHFGKMTPFTTQKIEIEKGDCIYLFSDGYADQFGGSEGKKFKSLCLRELLLEISPLPMSEQKIRLNETIENWKGINEQVDDILLIGIRF